MATEQTTRDQIDVLRRHNKPAHFLWRGRLYGVRSVLGHWIECDQQLVQCRGRGSLADREVWRASAAEPASSSPREVWRVEASAGRCAQPMTFDLSVSARESWTLAEVGT